MLDGDPFFPIILNQKLTCLSRSDPLLFQLKYFLWKTHNNTYMSYVLPPELKETQGTCL
ncbi:hypothetical protein EUTSA_v10017509mg [Eutrema salsugineum]|uniref:Uncharacterized protein n=1 Tax=Eutrema salsugineum TaxID=72664 RepID=V4MGX0_EUTSA|nr:hypothetical protein EUTSA_v10017509mg [Eutrema salsugineum]